MGYYHINIYIDLSKSLNVMSLSWLKTATSITVISVSHL